MPQIEISAYQDLERQRNAMREERESFITHWRDISEWMQPRKGRFFIQDRNKGERRNQRIINSAAGQAIQIARSGMLAGVMSPARPWLALETLDPFMMESQAVRIFCDDVVQLMQRIFASSNLYGMSSSMIGELLTFGVGCMLDEDDYESVSRYYTQTIGSYMIAQNDRYQVDTLCREFEWSVAQIVKKFGKENVSTQVMNAYDRGDYTKWYPVCHYISPNDNYKQSNPFTKPFKSVYYEPGCTRGDQQKVLESKGFDEFPAYVPRWELTGEDVYATDCPGMTALGDVRQLQSQEREKGKGIAKMVSPPLKGPASLRNVPINTLPGGATLYDGDSTREGLSPVFMVNPQLGELRLDMDAVERRIKHAFHNPLFMAITDMEGIQPRNQLDLTKRDQERLLQLGPVLQRLEQDFLNNLVNRTFNKCVRAGLIGGPKGIPIPRELGGSELEPRYISSLAMAQRAVATGSIERLMGFVGGYVQATQDTSILDKFDADQAVDEFANVTGVPPRIIRSDETVSERRAERAKQQQQAAEAEQAQMMAATAKDGAQALATAQGATNGQK